MAASPPTSGSSLASAPGVGQRAAVLVGVQGAERDAPVELSARRSVMELVRGGWGPRGDDGYAARGQVLTVEASVAYARSLARRHPENFTVLSALVPGRLVDDFAAVYAFCRWADDLSDETGSDAAARRRSLELLDWWRHELDVCFMGRASHPVMIALAQTVRRHDLPAQPFIDLIEAFRLDQSKTLYATWEELMAYCRLSADPVGRIILMLGGYRLQTHPELFALSDLGCSALQITNHLQDCGRDLTDRGEGGRVYLPTEITGLDAAALLAMRRGAGIGTREDRAAFARAITPLWERTEEMYREALTLPQRLGHDLRAVVWLLLQGGHQTHAAIKADGMCPLWRRPRLSRPRAAWLVAWAASCALARMVRA